MSNRRLVTATCASCGKEFTGIRNLNENGIYCCCVKCSGAYRKSADLHARREKRPYTPVKILITRGLDIYPELAPTVCEAYIAYRKAADEYNKSKVDHAEQRHITSGMKSKIRRYDRAKREGRVHY